MRAADPERTLRYIAPAASEPHSNGLGDFSCGFMAADHPHRTCNARSPSRFVSRPPRRGRRRRRHRRLRRARLEPLRPSPPSPPAPVAPTQRRPAATTGLTAHEIYERDAPGVAFVTSTVVQKSESPFNLFGGAKPRARARPPAPGIVIDANGTILTNYHVIENAIKVNVSFEKGKTVEAQVVGKDPSNDLAVLRIPTDGLTLHPLELGNSSAVQVGEPVLRDRQPVRPPTDAHHRHHLRAAARNHGPQRLHHRQRPADRRADQPRQLRRPAAQRPGPGDRHQLPDRDRRQRRDGSVGIGFAVPINKAKSEIPAAREGRHRPRRLPRPHLADDRRLAVRAEPARQERRPGPERAEGHRRRKGRHQRRHRQHATPKTARWPSAATSSSRSTARDRELRRTRQRDRGHTSPARP